MDSSAKKPWETPQLVVLVHSKPEEAVLTACKMDGDFSGTPLALAPGCDVQVGECLSCETRACS